MTTRKPVPVLKRTIAVRNPLTRAPIIQQQTTGLGTSNVPVAPVKAVRNPLARGV